MNRSVKPPTVVPRARGPKSKAVRNPYYSGSPNDHFDGTHFFNPGGIAPAGFRDLMRWQFGGGRAKWPAAAPSPFPQAKPSERLDDSRLRVTMVGHSTLLVQVAGLNIVTDPVWSERASPFAFAFAGPRRVNAPGIAFDDLPAIDLVLVSHNHYDHLDLRSLRRLVDRHDPMIVTPLGNDRLIRKAAPGARVAAHDWGDQVAIGASANVHVVPVHHWSARGMRDRRMALWSGFVVEAEAGSVYFAGDTGFHDGRQYRYVAERHGPPRLAILPIGAYAPRWFMKAQHQNPREAVEAMKLTGAAFAAGCHWGTFQLTDEPIGEPAERLGEAITDAGLQGGLFRALRPGEVWDIPETG